MFYLFTGQGPTLEDDGGDAGETISRAVIGPTKAVIGDYGERDRESWEITVDEDGNNVAVGSFPEAAGAPHKKQSRAS